MIDAEKKLKAARADIEQVVECMRQDAERGLDTYTIDVYIEMLEGVAEELE